MMWGQTPLERLTRCRKPGYPHGDSDIHVTALQKVYTLTHSKSETVHTLTGLPTAQGLYLCQFQATADFTQGIPSPAAIPPNPTERTPPCQTRPLSPETW